MHKTQRNKAFFIRFSVVCSLGTVYCVLSTPCAAEDLSPLRIAVHVHTGVSDGPWTPTQTLREAERVALDGVVFADTLVERWEYGVPPWRRVIRRTFEQPSVLTWGARQYLQHVRAVAQQFPSMVVIPGVTVAPFYRWTGIPVYHGGALVDWHRQLVVLGIEDPQALTALPAVSNHYGSWLRVARAPWRLWPFLILLLGAVGWWRQRRGRVVWGSIILLGLVTVWNIEPGRTSRWVPYGGDPGVAPYQELIDVVRAHDGMAWWSHPMLQSQAVFRGVPVNTEPYPELLFESTGYQGFGMNYGVFLSFAEPGQAWDRLIQAYCDGTRAAPPWLFGEIAWHAASRPLDTVITVTWASQRTPSAVLAAMQAGRMHAQFNDYDRTGIQLDTYAVRDPQTPATRPAHMGDTLETRGPVMLHVAGSHTLPQLLAPLQLHVIRNGEVVHTAPILEPVFTMTWTDTVAPTEPLWYYRVFVHHDTIAVVTNPTFVHNSRKATSDYPTAQTTPENAL